MNEEPAGKMGKQLTDRILEYLEEKQEANSLDLSQIFNEDHQKIVGAIKSLCAIGDLIETTPLSQKKWEVTSEGQHVIDHGSHEAAVYRAVSDSGTPQAEIMKTVPFAKVGFSKAIVAGWIELDKSSSSGPLVRKKVKSIVDTTQNHLKDISNIPENLKAEYKKRKLLQEIVIKAFLLGKGPNFSTKVEKMEADLTADLLANGAWKQKKFKPYNFAALGSPLDVGHLHPLLKVRSEFRKIFLEMGFTEMPTNNFVESSFWNFDALFQPQQHPARDAHDTFFISDPKLSTDFPGEYLERVKKVHSQGGYGSQGYRYDWKIEEAQKNLLRTHTTAVSARMLYNLMQQGDFKPVKYFSIDRVFRNETLDATHLAEFHQIEGVIADYGLTLGDLIGTIYEFFKKLGITQLEFKPAYNPYTEPSMEIFCYHEGLGKWIEIGNSGMFRPEMLLPMGLPSDVNVIAWGLSLERPTMIKYGLNNIRDLVGPKVDMEMVYNNPICRLDKTTRRDAPGKKPADGNGETRTNISPQELSVESNVPIPERMPDQRLTLHCDPKQPPAFLQPLFSLVKSRLTISVSTHLHSSVATLPENLVDFCSEFQCRETEGDRTDIALKIIWKDMGVDPELYLTTMRKITGHVNIARYLNRFVESHHPDLLRYERNGAIYANRIDTVLDKLHEEFHSGSVAKVSRKSRYFMGDHVSMVDLLLECRK